jgi:ABC-type transport system substrate-binding protein
LLAEAGYNAQRPLRLKIAISSSGSGQMLPLPMNEFMQQSLKENCGVEVTFDVVEWNTLLGAQRVAPDQPQWLGADATNTSLVSSDPSQMARWFLSANFSPRGSNSASSRLAAAWRRAASKTKAPKPSRTSA